PGGEQAGELARVLVITRPFERFACLLQLGVEHLGCIADSSRPQRHLGAFGALPAVDPRRAEEHHRVLDLLLLESSERLEVLGEDSNGTGFLALEKFGIEICQRLLRHTTPTLPSAILSRQSSVIVRRPCAVHEGAARRVSQPSGDLSSKRRLSTCPS